MTVTPRQECVATTAPTVRTVCAADITPVQVSWLWPQWLPYGKLVGLDGPPGVGKSSLIVDLIARASRGDAMPGAAQGGEPTCVLIGGLEDDVADTVRPRLDAAGADLSKVFVLEAEGDSEIVTVPRCIDQIERIARERGVKWLHIDCLFGMLDPDVRTNSDPAVRHALQPLKRIAAELGMLVTFIRHPRKAGGSGVSAGGGSIGISALSRVILYAGVHPEDRALGDEAAKRRVLSVAKSNLARMPRSRLFDLVDTGGQAAKLVWGDCVNVSADELASVEPPPQTRSAAESAPRRIEATELLQSLLGEGGPVPVEAIRTVAEAKGVAWRTVERVASAIGVIKERRGAFGGGGDWRLPIMSLAVNQAELFRSANDPRALPPLESFPPLALEHNNDGGNVKSGGNGCSPQDTLDGEGDGDGADLAA